MIGIRRSDDRGPTKLDWLDSQHTFSFDEYFDPKEKRVLAPRVINDDRIAAGLGIVTHPHRDMEIVTYVLEGEVEHLGSLKRKLLSQNVHHLRNCRTAAKKISNWAFDPHHLHQ